MSKDSISHEIVVEAGRAAVFDAFTNQLGAWWPLGYTFAGTDFGSAGVEPRAGGIWFERDLSDRVRPWGQVRAYEPLERLVLGFGVGPDRQSVPDDAASELEVRFTDDDRGRTRIAVFHRDFDRHGTGADAVRSGMDSAAGWPLILAELRRWIRSRPAVRYIVANMDTAVRFYTTQLGFVLELRPAPGFAALSQGSLRLLLNEPGAGGAGASVQGLDPQPGGWARLQLVLPDLSRARDRLTAAGCAVRGDIVQGRGGDQLLVEDPSGNLVELFDPRPRTPARS